MAEKEELPAGNVSLRCQASTISIVSFIKIIKKPPIYVNPISFLLNLTIAKVHSHSSHCRPPSAPRPPEPALPAGSGTGSCILSNQRAPEVRDLHNMRSVTRWSGYLSDTLETATLLMTSHTFQLSFVLSELFRSSSDLDTQECWRTGFSCPTLYSPRTKREIKLPPGQRGYSFFDHSEQPQG